MASLSVPDHIPAFRRDLDSEVSRLMEEPLPALDARRAGWITLCWLVNQVAAGVGLAMITSMSTAVFGGSGSLSNCAVGLIGVVAGTIATFGAVSMFRASFVTLSGYKAAIGERAVSLGVLAIAVAVGVVLQLLCVQALLWTFPAPDTYSPGPLADAMKDGFASRITAFACGVFLTPLVEELFFRGVLYSALARSWSVTAAASTATLLFVVMHINSTSMYWPRLGVVLVLGASAQIARIKTRSIWPGVAMHFAWNALSLGFYLPG